MERRGFLGGLVGLFGGAQQRPLEMFGGKEQSEKAKEDFVPLNELFVSTTNLVIEGPATIIDVIISNAGAHCALYRPGFDHFMLGAAIHPHNIFRWVAAEGEGIVVRAGESVRWEVTPVPAFSNYSEVAPIIQTIYKPKVDKR